MHYLLRKLDTHWGRLSSLYMRLCRPSPAPAGALVLRAIWFSRRRIDQRKEESRAVHSERHRPRPKEHAMVS
jgi:hypothetical protein